MSSDWCWKGCCTHHARVAWAFCFVIVGFILDVIGFSVPYWYYENNGGTKMYEGLWKKCEEVALVMTCTNWTDVPSPAWFKANQAMQTIGMLLFLAAVVLMLVLLICHKGNYSIRIAAISLLLGAALFILIGVIIYGAKSTDMVQNNLNFGFIFVVIAAGFAIIGAIILFVGVMDDWEEDEEESS